MPPVLGPVEHPQPADNSRFHALARGLLYGSSMTLTGNRHTRRVLLVDDEEALVWSLGSRLGKCRSHYSIVTANEGETALLELGREAVDLLVVDVRMPGMSGIDLVLAARSMTPDLPVIVMTAFKTVDVNRIVGGTCTNFLEKPFEFDVFLDLVDRSLTPSRGFSGAISVQTLPEVVQLYVLSNTSGVLSVRHDRNLGTLWFDRGMIIHATVGSAIGEDAFYEIMSWPTGEFSMGPMPTQPQRSIVADWQGLLLESCRRLDERHRAVRPDRGWTESPPSWPVDSFADFELDAVAARPIEPTPPPPTQLSVDPALQEKSLMNIKQSLAKLHSIDGFIGAALVDSESGMMLGSEGGGDLDLALATAGNTEVMRAKRKTTASLNLKDGIEDMLITLGKQYHLIRPLRSRNAVFLYLAIDRQRANPALARITLAEVEKTLSL